MNPCGCMCISHYIYVCVYSIYIYIHTDSNGTFSIHPSLHSSLPPSIHTHTHTCDNGASTPTHTYTYGSVFSSSMVVPLKRSWSFGGKVGARLPSRSSRSSAMSVRFLGSFVLNTLSLNPLTLRLLRRFVVTLNTKGPEPRGIEKLLL